ncbi:fimb protein [Steroidobacter agaridevorans]|uniref:Fimb protein n=1 Tax=Steroidobacter agaridevorans TaxID=2695856 RepID=A0A829YJ70_9GAMM|nr:TfpX/TfpZ family type IV pilin accessory protein [Steroidobacter agaridevorans]GFE83335.1 fimb protein [Steroidobacter agaridevorans]GFE86769.1 fimb protein [Steroidobacter agaridevorans]
MIVWREKFRALLLHFLVTAAVAAVAAAVIFFVWFPDPFQAMMGGTKLFLLISACDLALGPLISLVIYNSKKSRRELITDYSIVGAVQLAALVYGVLSIADARPVYVAFVGTRFEVVAASDLTDENLQAGRDPYRTRPKWGPELIATQMPTDVKERNDLLFSALAGKDIQAQPRYYVPYETAKEELKRRAQPMEALYKHHPEAKQLVQAAKLAVPESELRWLPIQGRGFWTVLLDANGGPPLAYLPLDPYDS